MVAQGGDGGTVDIGMACLSGMFERNDDVLYICYDNQAYMNTGVQRSGATPPAARTATTAVGPEPGNRFGQGKNVPSERTVTVAIGHGKKAARNIDAWLRTAATPGRASTSSPGSAASTPGTTPTPRPPCGRRWRPPGGSPHSTRW